MDQEVSQRNGNGIEENAERGNGKKLGDLVLHQDSE